MTYFRLTVLKLKNLNATNIKTLSTNEILIFLKEETKPKIHKYLTNELRKKLDYNFKNLLLKEITL
jgi:hypothetical protein